MRAIDGSLCSSTGFGEHGTELVELGLEREHPFDAREVQSFVGQLLDAARLR